MSLPKMSTCIGVLKVIAILLLMLLVWLEIVPSSWQEDKQYIVNVGFQRERDQLFVNSLYTLQYRPESEKAQAISDLQTSLLAFQQEQTQIWQNPDPDVKRYLRSAQPDYLAIVAAVRVLLAHPDDPVNRSEFTIILSHHQHFFPSMNALVTLLNRDLENRITQLMDIQIALEVTCLIIILLPFRAKYMWRRRSSS